MEAQTKAVSTEGSSGTIVRAWLHGQIVVWPEKWTLPHQKAAQLPRSGEGQRELALECTPAMAIMRHHAGNVKSGQLQQGGSMRSAPALASPI